MTLTLCALLALAAAPPPPNERGCVEAGPAMTTWRAEENTAWAAAVVDVLAKNKLKALPVTTQPGSFPPDPEVGTKSHGVLVVGYGTILTPAPLVAVDGAGAVWVVVVEPASETVVMSCGYGNDCSGAAPPRLMFTVAIDKKASARIRWGGTKTLKTPASHAREEFGEPCPPLP